MKRKVPSTVALREEEVTKVEKPRVSFFNNVLNTTPSREFTLRGVLRKMEDGKWKEEVGKVRAVKDKDQRNELKRTLLPAVTISGTFTERKKDKLINHSGFICIDQSAGDLDNKEIKQQLEKDKYTHACFYSASGKDLAIIVKIDPKKHKQAFEGLKAYYKKKFGFEIDSCQDISRARFISYDPELIYKSKSAVFEKYPKEKKTKASLPARKLPTEKLEAEVRYICDQIVEQEIIITGKEDKHDNWVRVGFSLVDGLGEEGRPYFHLISSISDKYKKKIADDQYDDCLKSHKDRTGKMKLGINYFRNLAKNAGLRIHKGLENDRRFTETGRCILEPQLEARIYKENGDKRFIIYNSQLLMYDEGFYQHFKDEYHLKLLENQIEYIHDGRVSKAEEILKALKHQHHEKKQIDVNQKPHLINVKNGILDISTKPMKLLNHTPDIIFIYQISVNYNPDAECEQWREFLKDVLVKENKLTPDIKLIKNVRRFIGYCFYTALPFHEAFIFYGNGRNGKSVITKVMEMLFEGLYSTIHFEEIGNDKFFTSELSGKLVNISSEFSAKFKMDDRQFKMIVKGEAMTAQRKHEKAFQLKPTVKHVITTNNLPRSKDKSLGFFSTINIIPFHKTFLPKEELKRIKDTDMKEKFKLRIPNYEDQFIPELEGIFLWAIKGLKLLLREGQFPYSKQIAKAKRAFIVHNSSVEMFFKEEVEEDSQEDTLLTEMYRAYLRYCTDNKVPPITNKWFASECRNLYEVQKMGSGGKNHVRGVYLKNEDV